MNEEEIKDILDRCNSATSGPWKSWVEGRDGLSGDSFIMTGTDNKRGEDFYLTGGTNGDLDFIAHARQDIPRLIAEIKRLKTK